MTIDYLSLLPLRPPVQNILLHALRASVVPYSEMNWNDD